VVAIQGDSKEGREILFGLGQKLAARARRQRFRVALAVADGERDRREWAAAQAAYEQVLALEADRGDLWVQLGHCFKEQGLLAAAKGAYEHALATSARGDALLHLGHIAKMEARFADALSLYRQSSECEGEGSDAATEIRSIREWNGDKPSASSSNVYRTEAADNMTEIDKHTLLTVLAHIPVSVPPIGDQAARIAKRRSELVTILKLSAERSAKG